MRVFVQGLQQLGWIQSRNLHVDSRRALIPTTVADTRRN